MLLSSGGTLSRPMHRRTLQSGNGTHAMQAWADGGTPHAWRLSPSHMVWGVHASKDPHRATRICRRSRRRSQDRSTGAIRNGGQPLRHVPTRGALHARARSNVAQTKRGERAESTKQKSRLIQAPRGRLRDPAGSTLEPAGNTQLGQRSSECGVPAEVVQSGTASLATSGAVPLARSSPSGSGDECTHY